eukprot:CAMPEP_0184863398 /NCGR_PEP_ID=MMETSP0580-20130426/10912_1 /TAXON_ID=1118495 /ORGANISM="Dactyliosolen fragilissimus" /LENGTH=399 /DNA_ID=CAMNT_0027361705 /DNA_START=60 /DNA_END=1259 /DNA_ORIENTATION=+
MSSFLIFFLLYIIRNIHKLTSCYAFAPLISRSPVSNYYNVQSNSKHILSSSFEEGVGKDTELPDSLEDAAMIAASSCYAFSIASGPMSRCRVDFDTSIGDETYTTLKSSTEFMQKFVSALCYESIPGLAEMRQDEMMRCANARSELRQIIQEEQVDRASITQEQDGIETENSSRKKQLEEIIINGGRDPSFKWTGPTARIYFPDEGSAALARRDWNPTASSADEALVPPCVQFASCGGVQSSFQDSSRDVLVFYFCPRASEAEYVEKTLYDAEDTLCDQLALTIFVNPLLVDMGVTGFGMAGRMLRERLIDNLQSTYYLRTLQWGALTRVWPKQFTIWQEDDDADGGYKLLKSLDRMPSNPEVEDIYDYENGISVDPSQQKGLGFLNALGDFVNGMTRL